VLFYAIPQCLGCVQRLLDGGGYVSAVRMKGTVEPVFHEMAAVLSETESNSWPIWPRQASRWEAVATDLALRGASPDAINAQGLTPSEVFRAHDLRCHRAQHGNAASRVPLRESAAALRWHAWRRQWALRETLDRRLPIIPVSARRGRM
jgi:hypothetical protein